MDDLFNDTVRLLSEKLSARDETINELRRELFLARSNIPADNGIRMIVGSVCPICHRVEMVPVEGYALTGEDDCDIEVCGACITTKGQ